MTIAYLLFWAVLFVVMMRFGCGAHVMGHHRHAHGGDARAGGANPGEEGSSAPDKTRDPVCGMTVVIAGAKSSIWQGTPYYFCSQDCREKFEAAPQTYAGGVPAPHQKGA